MDFLTAPTTIITVIGTGVGIGEALIFYNLGQKQGLPFMQKFSGWKLPPKKDLIETISVVMVTSMLPGIITDLLMKGLMPEDQYAQRTGNQRPNAQNKV